MTFTPPVSYARLIFTNVDAETVIVIDCSRASVAHILSWYGGFHGGDEYTVTMDGRPLTLDHNGDRETVEIEGETT
jgi:hypothetical protein